MDFLIPAKTISLKCLRISIILGVFTVLYVCTLSSYRILDTTVINISDNPDGKTERVELPHSAPSAYSFQKVPAKHAKSYRYSIDVLGYFPQSISWKIHADDCITAIDVNDRSVSLDSYGKQALCANPKGFFIDLGNYVRSGHNRIDITINDVRGGNYSLDIKPVYIFLNKDIYRHFNLVFLISAWIFVVILRQLNFDGVLISIALFTYYVYLRDFQVTGIKTHHPDWWGHIPYLFYIKNHWLPPPSYAGWEFWHPPLYYIVAAIVGGIGQLMDYSFLRSALAVSMVSVLIFVTYGMLLIRRAVKNVWIQRVCVCAFLFWPLISAFVSTISNEVFSYAFWSGAIYHFMRWYLDKSKKHFAIAIVLCGIMAVVRTTALVPAGVGGVLFLSALITKRVHLKDYLTLRMILIATFVLLCFSFNFGRTYYYKTFYAPRMGMIISNIHKDPVLYRIHSTASFKKLFTIDFRNLFSGPYTNFWHDSSGRQLFWNTYIKTVLFGFFGWPNAHIAIKLVMLLSALMLYAVTAPLFMGRIDNTHWFLFTCTFVTIAAHMVNRVISATVICHDGRLTFPVTITFIAWIGYVIQTLMEQGHRKKPIQFGIGVLGLVLLTAFALTSLIFDLKYIGFFRFL
jgi:hypothetical protein